MLLRADLRQPVVARDVFNGDRIGRWLKAEILARIERLAARNQGNRQQAKTNGWFPPIALCPFWQGDWKAQGGPGTGLLTDQYFILAMNGRRCRGINLAAH